MTVDALAEAGIDAAGGAATEELRTADDRDHARARAVLRRRPRARTVAAVDGIDLRVERGETARATSARTAPASRPR